MSRVRLTVRDQRLEKVQKAIVDAGDVRVEVITKEMNQYCGVNSGLIAPKAGGSSAYYPIQYPLYPG
jgi:hypothetical protein